MIREDFQNLWNLYYPESEPISYSFKHAYSDRWFRIHSLPESKRFVAHENEWDILLSRQKQIITDLFGLETPILIVTGEYKKDDNSQIQITEGVEIFKPYSWIPLENIQLNKIDALNYDESDIYKPAFAHTIWKPEYHDKLLREIANDTARAFFVSFEKNILVAPYDGGVDFILKDSQTRDHYKEKYKQWLSQREDGL